MMKLFFKLILSVLLIVVCVVLWGHFWHWFTKEPEFTAEEWKARSILHAGKRLDEYVKLEGLNREDFTGPYVRQGDNPDPPVFTTCFKSKTHYFCYNQAGNMDYGYPFDKIECKSEECQWLWSQP